nr:solute carrier family 25 (mitochondrial iron transporter), member 28/37 [Cryptococcus depauperatus CBS 7841]ODN95401.1 solute carrier family 25 (mitochondrial iron transporter), member 28/37 [Cryptococcus depauperatus CBS 7855]
MSQGPVQSSSSVNQLPYHPHVTHKNHTLPAVQVGEPSIALEAEDELDYESLPIGSGWGVNMIAGAMAGISEHAAIFPIDSIKVSTGSTARAIAPQLETVSQHLRSISTTEGLRSLWRGVASVILGAGPAHAAHFGMYEFVREISGGRSDGWHGVVGTAVAGAAATISSDALMNPFDVIKQRMQIRNSPYRTVLSCARTLYAREGLSAFYVSYPTTLTMSVPFTAVQFSSYEYLKSILNPSGSYSPSTHVIAGGIAGALAAAVTTPLDVAKTLLQTRGSSLDARIRSARGMGEALKIIWERDGWRGLRRGMAPRMLTVAPSTAISWMSYEFFKVLIRQNGSLPESGQSI